MRPVHYILWILAALWSLVSCIADKPVVPAEKARTIEFTLSNSSPQTQATRATRAIDDLEENEKAINRLDVFFYDETGTTCLFYPAAGQLARNEAASKVTIIIPEDIYDGSLRGNKCTIWLLANSPLTRSDLEGKTLEELKNLVAENSGSRLFNLENLPADFIMTGEISVDMDSETNRLGTIKLRRAAAKIVVDISKASVAGYTPATARVRLSGYLDKTRIGNETEAARIGDYRTSEWKTLTKGEGSTYSMGAADALFTYSNDWSKDADRESYLTVELEWMKNDDGTTKTYYYRIPFSYIDAGENAAAHKNRIRRNYVYQFMVDVSALGGLDPEKAVDLAANFEIIDWSDKKLEVSILSYHYLFVYNSRMQIHEASYYEWEYRSSLPVTIDVISVTCTEYSPDGASHPVSYVPGDDQYPVIATREEVGRTWFSAASMVPENYVPLVVRLRVANSAQLFSNVELIIYPKRYVTASWSDNRPLAAGSYTAPDNSNTGSGHGTNNPNGDGPEDNFNFYRITTTSLDAADAARGIMLGDPTEAVPHPAGESYGNMPYNSTLTDEGNNNMISPEFIVASRRGITTTLTWDNARERCARYRESQYPAGTWRVPTFAELAMLGDMQNDPKSAIKNLFVTEGNDTGAGWWSARERYWIRVDRYKYATGNGVQSANATAKAFVRCVHDTWRDK